MSHELNMTLKEKREREEKRSFVSRAGRRSWVTETHTESAHSFHVFCADCGLMSEEFCLNMVLNGPESTKHLLVAECIL